MIKSIRHVTWSLKDFRLVTTKCIWSSFLILSNWNSQLLWKIMAQRPCQCAPQIFMPFLLPPPLFFLWATSSQWEYHSSPDPSFWVQAKLTNASVYFSDPHAVTFLWSPLLFSPFLLKQCHPVPNVHCFVYYVSVWYKINNEWNQLLIKQYISLANITVETDRNVSVCNFKSGK